MRDDDESIKTALLEGHRQTTSHVGRDGFGGVVASAIGEQGVVSETGKLDRRRRWLVGMGTAVQSVRVAGEG